MWKMLAFVCEMELCSRLGSSGFVSFMNVQLFDNQTGPWVDFHVEGLKGAKQCLVPKTIIFYYCFPCCYENPTIPPQGGGERGAIFC